MEGATKDKDKKSLPPNISTPRRGPLLLQKLTSPKTAAPSELSTRDKRCHFIRLSSRRRPRAKQGYLTRYPVERVPPKPMDVIEDHLVSGLTWSELRHNLHVMEEVHSHRAPGEKEGGESSILQHRMKYCSHGNDPLLSIERYTHSMSSEFPAGPGKLNVSITCSRNEQRWLSTTLTQQPLTTVFPPAWTRKGPGTAPPSREKERDHLQATNEEELPPSSPSSSSLAVYKTIVGLNRPELKPTSTGNPGLTEPSSLTETKPLKVYLSSHIGASIAPAGVRAVATHRLRPITSNTMIMGKRITVAR